MSDKKKSVSEVIKDVFKKYDLRVGPMDQLVDDVMGISTGNIAIDHLTGVHGIPLGRSVELYGAPSSGKSTCAIMTAANIQKIILSGGNEKMGIATTDKIAYLDFEQAMDIKYCRDLGLDVNHDSFLFSQPSTIEEGANLARDLVQTGEVRLLIWDSIAAAVPDIEAQKEIGASAPAAAAKLYAIFTKTLNEPLRQNNCTALWINHISEMMDMGGMRRPGMPARTTTPGGRALKFYSSVRLEFTQIGNVKGTVEDELLKEESEVAIATNVRVKVTKNKVGSPFKQAIVRVRYGKGFDNFYTALQILVAHKKIPYSMGYYYFDKSPELIHGKMEITAKGREHIRGNEAILDFADANPEWRQAVIDVAEKLVFSDITYLDAITPMESPKLSEQLDADEDYEPDEEEEAVDSPEDEEAQGKSETLVFGSSAEIDALFDD